MVIIGPDKLGKAMKCHLLFRLIFVQLLFPVPYQLLATSAIPDTDVALLIGLSAQGTLTEQRLNDLIFNRKVDVNAKNPQGFDALSAASGEGKLSVVNLLLSYGANVNVTGPDGSTPLMDAAFEGHDTVVEALLKARANPFITNTSGGWKDFDAEAIAKARGHKRIARLIAIAKKEWEKENVPSKLPVSVVEEIKARPGWHSIIHDIVTNSLDQEKLTKYLKQGVDINWQNQEGLTPLRVAIFKNNTNIINLLLDNGANINLLSIYDGIPPLMFAITGNHDTAVNLLLKRNANINVKTKDGNNALLMAVLMNSESAVDSLLKYADRIQLDRQTRRLLDTAILRANPNIRKKVEDFLKAEKKPTKKSAPTVKEEVKQKEERTNEIEQQIVALLSKENLKYQDFHKAEDLVEQYKTELIRLAKFKNQSPSESDIEHVVEPFRAMINEIKCNFINEQEEKVLDIITKNPSPTLLKAAKKAIVELESLQIPELQPKIEGLKKNIEEWSKKPAIAELTEEEKQKIQEQKKVEARKLVQKIDEALNANNVDTVQPLLREAKGLSTDPNIQRQLVSLEERYKKQRADILQAEYEKTLAAYKQKPTVDREQKVRFIIKALEDLNIPQLKEFTRAAYQQLKTIAKEAASVPTEEKKRISPTPAPEPQQLLFIFDPYNQLEPLPKEIKSRAEEALKELSLGYKNSSAVELKGKGLEGLWRIRVGNYRIVYKILREKDAIAVVMIDARGEIYETEDEQLQRTRNADLIDIDVWRIDKLLEDAKNLLKGEDVSATKAAYAESLLELYRWQLRGYPADEEYLNSLLLSGKAAFKMNDLAKARERFADMIPQATDFPKIKKQAEASLAEVDKRLASFQAGRRITPPSPARISPTPQKNVVGKLRDEYQEACQLLVTNPEKATQLLEQFSKESQPYAKELAQERRAADMLLNNEPLFSSAMDYLEDGKFDDAISSFNSYLKEVGTYLPTRRRQLIDEEIAQSELGRTLRKAAEKRLVK